MGFMDTIYRAIFINNHNDPVNTGYMIEAIMEPKVITDVDTISDFMNNDFHNELMESDSSLFIGILHEDNVVGMYRHHHSLINAVSEAYDLQVKKIYDFSTDDFFELSGKGIEEDCRSQLL